MQCVTDYYGITKNKNMLIELAEYKSHFKAVLKKNGSPGVYSQSKQAATGR